LYAFVRSSLTEKNLFFAGGAGIMLFELRTNSENSHTNPYKLRNNYKHEKNHTILDGGNRVMDVVQLYHMNLSILI
jgi:hypothetical protein